MKKIFFAFGVAMVVLSACGTNGSKKNTAPAAEANTIKDDTLYPFMLGGVYFFEGYGGGQETLNQLIKGQMQGKPGDDNFLPELHSIYTNYFEYAFKPEDGAGARQTLKDYWDAGDKASFLKMQEELITSGHQKKYLALSAAGATAKTAGDKEMLAFITAHKAEFPKAGIKAWDIARYVNNTAIGYAAGFITKEEGNAALAKLAPLAKAQFTGWDEYWKSYNLGRKFWAGDKEHDADYDKTTAGMQQGDYSIYKYMKL